MIDHPHSTAQVMRVPGHSSAFPSVETDAGAIRRGLTELANHHGVNARLAAAVWGLAGAEGHCAGGGWSEIGERDIPFEISVALGRKPGGLRYQSEVGGGETIWERLSNSRRALPTLLELLGLQAERLPELVDLLLPEYIDQFPRERRGIWVSPAITPAGGSLNTCVNTGWREMEESWPMACHLLDRLGRGAARRQLEAIRPLLRDVHRISFISLETTTDGIGRMGVHFRGTALTRDLALRVARVVGDGAAPVPDLWDAFVADRTPDPEETVLSIMIPEGDAPLGMGIEIGAGSLGIPNAKLLPYIHHIARTMALDPEDYVTTLEVMGRMGVGPARHVAIGMWGDQGGPGIDIIMRPQLR